MEWGISLKLQNKGIRFYLLISFVVLSVSIVLLLGVLQIGFIKPYYRQSKMNTTRAMVETLQKELLSSSGGKKEDIENAFQQTVENGACVVIYNSDGNKVYTADLLGSGCILTQSKQYTDLSTLQSLTEENGEYSENVINPKTQQEMLVYGKKVQENLGTYYVFMNTPLEPVDSIITFFSRQYSVYVIFVIVASLIFSFWISGKIARPIQNMEKEAVKLSNARYEAHFEGGAFMETQELASTLNKASKDLGKIEELRRDIIANVSHDIRTPITNIRAYAEMIRDISGDSVEKRNKHLSIIIKETEFMNTLVDQMSELSQMQSGNYQLHKKNVDIVQVIQQVVDMDTPSIMEAHLQIHMDMPESLTMYADEGKILEVVHNYLTNAIKHSHDGGMITIRAYILDDEETIRVEVKDEGEGIPIEEIPFIWNRYQKASRSFYRSLNSTGLGLSIVKAILDAHGATYGVESKVNEGSTFWFEIQETHEG